MPIRRFACQVSCWRRRLPITFVCELVLWTERTPFKLRTDSRSCSNCTGHWSGDSYVLYAIWRVYLIVLPSLYFRGRRDNGW
jgi:hypothetical protein